MFVGDAKKRCRADGGSGRDVLKLSGGTLLAGVALGALSPGLMADELAGLKSQLEALQTQVGDLERKAAGAPTLPDGSTFITFARGEGTLGTFGRRSKQDDYNPDRGFLLAITPAADIPAPVAEVALYGYVKGDVIFDFDKDIGDVFYVPSIWSQSGRNDQHVRLHARQSRFGIRSKVDTAIGQIRTLIEADLLGSSSTNFRLRHAWGEWDFAPSWTFAAGQYWQTAALLPVGITTVDDSGDAGPFGYTRKAQVRLTYHSGPVSWAVAAEEPTFTSSAEWPNFSSYLQYDTTDGHQFIVTGIVSDYDNDRPDPAPSRTVGWAIQAGANINIADAAVFTFGGIYGQGESCNYINQTLAWCGVSDADKDGSDDFVGDADSYGAFAGFTFNLNDTTSINVEGGWSHLDNGFGGARAETIKGVDAFTAHGNILWQPVEQLRLGWELMWGLYDWDARTGPDAFDGAAKREDDAIRAQFGAWFFF